MKKIIVPIKGMHCKSCEIIVEEKVSKLGGIKKVKVDCKKNIAEIYYKSEKPSEDEIGRVVAEAGYSVGKEENTFFSRDEKEYKDLGVALLFLLGIYLLLRNVGLTEIEITPSSSSYTIPLILLIGLVAGLSTCMALVGGLVLGISARHKELHPEASAMQNFRPHLFFNFGRIVIFGLLGGALGVFGSVFQLSPLVLGLMTIAVGIVMLILGVKLVGIFPMFEKYSLTLPKSISKPLGLGADKKEYSHTNSFVLGGLTFFLPCGFTQAMQIYAVSSGSFIGGALAMGLFALGTSPGLLGIGSVASFAKGIFARRFFKFAGIVVIILSFFNLNNGYNLLSVGLAGSGSGAVENISSSEKAGKYSKNVQVIQMKQDASGYSPNKLTVKKGVPVRWEIYSENLNTCASSILAPKAGVRLALKKGKNIVEFVPKEEGIIPFSCPMGMHTGTIVVTN